MKKAAASKEASWGARRAADEKTVVPLSEAELQGELSDEDLGKVVGGVGGPEVTMGNARAGNARTIHTSITIGTQTSGGE